MELLLHQWGDWPELYRNTDKTEAAEIVIIDSQMNYRGKLDTYLTFTLTLTFYNICFFLISHDIMTSVSGVIAQLVRALR